MPTATEQSSGQNAAARPISFTFGQREDDFVNCESACGRHHTSRESTSGLGAQHFVTALRPGKTGNRFAFLPVPLAEDSLASDIGT